MKQTLLVVCGAVVGGGPGYLTFFWVASQGYYALAVPGGMLGVGAGMARNRSLPLVVACGLAALALGVITEWRFAPFIADTSLGYFLTHLHELKPITLVMILLGGAVGFWIPYRRIDDGLPPKT